MITPEFLITSLVVVLVPGTGVLYTVSTGLAQGRAASAYAALGCTAGIVPHLLATVLGLAAVMHTSALAFQLLKYAGVAYLFYVAAATWRDRSAFALFFLAFLPQFVDPAAGRPLVQLLLSAVFMLMTFAVFVLYGLAAHAFRSKVIGSPRVQHWLRRGFAAAFAGLGAKLAVSDR